MVMDNQPPVYVAQKSNDEEHLKLLSIFHFVFGGLVSLLGIMFLVIHFLILRVVFAQAGTWPTKDGSSPSASFFAGFIVFYVFAGFVLLTVCALNILSGIFLRQRKHRTFSIVIAALDCLQIPFGTVLGVFTIIVLQRDSVRQSYRS